MAKKQGIDWMRYIPIAVMAVSLISGYTLLKARVGNCEEKLKSYEVVQSKLASDSTEIKLSQVKTETKVDSMLEILKEIKSKV